MEIAKKTIRQEMRAARGAVCPADVRAAGSAVLERLTAFDTYRSVPALLVYLAKDNEIPTECLMADAFARGKRVFLRRVGEERFVEYRAGDRLVAGPYGLLEPTGRGPFDPATMQAVALVPLLAWDGAGCRLGRGNGWYDRVLARLGSAVTTIGIGYEFQRRERLPQGPGDVVLDYVLTEKRLVCCGGGRQSGHL